LKNIKKNIMYQKLILINFFIFSVLSNFLKTQDRCSQGCMQCNQSGECLQCQDSYYLDQESQQCLEIATRVLYNVKSCSEDERCAQCSEDGLCQECKDGYYDTEIYKMILIQRKNVIAVNMDTMTVFNVIHKNAQNVLKL
ncbi:hypothetical protein IMG5_139790, partial [Ichthyophthirius multifiliis]